jgi:hypothetical protein
MSRGMVSDVFYYVFHILRVCSLSSRLKGIIDYQMIRNDTIRKDTMPNHMQNADIFYSLLQPRHPVVIDVVSRIPLSHYLHRRSCLYEYTGVTFDTFLLISHLFMPHNVVFYVCHMVNILTTAYDSEKRCIENITRLRDDKYRYLDNVDVIMRPTHILAMKTTSSSSPSILLSDYWVKDIHLYAASSFNQQWNEKIIVLNLVSIEILLRLSPNFIDCYRANNHKGLGGCGGSGDSMMYGIIQDPFPHPSIFDSFGSLILKDGLDKWTSSPGVGREMKCSSCGLLYKLQCVNKGAPLILCPHFRHECVNFAMFGYWEESTGKVEVKLGNGLLHRRIEKFDDMILSCNEFVREHGIIEKLRADFPFLPFPDTYIDCLFHADGEPYRVSNDSRASSTVQRAQLLYHYYDNLKELLQAESVEEL